MALQQLSIKRKRQVRYGKMIMNNGYSWDVEGSGCSFFLGTVSEFA
jgi:hypothetical protein